MTFEAGRGYVRDDWDVVEFPESSDEELARTRPRRRSCRPGSSRRCRTTVVRSDYLGTPETRAEYMAAALEEGDAVEIHRALNTVARSLGMTAIAEEVGIGRESLYKALGDTGNLEVATVLKLMKAMGLKLSALPIEEKK